LLAAVALAAPSALHAQQPIRDRSSGLATGTAVLSGIVTTDTDPAVPIRRVAVTLNEVDGSYGATAVTDASGRFSFERLPAGRYQMVASRQPYVTTRHGARQIGRPGTPIAVADGERRDVTLRMPLGAVITGVVRDERGVPSPDMPVEAMAYRFYNGRRTLQRVGASQASDDRGVYRVFGLPPGEYHVSVRPPTLGGQPAIAVTTADEVQRAMRQSQGGLTGALPAASPEAAAPPPNAGYARVYFPGATSEADAAPIVVGPGDVRDGVDLRMQFVPLVTVSGHATLRNGQPAVFARGQLAPRDGPMDLHLGIVIVNAEGEFTVRGVPPGRFALALMGSSTPNPEGNRLPTDTPDVWGVARITVAGDDISDVAIRMQPTLTIEGRATFDGDGDPPAWSGVRVGLFPQIGADEVATTTGSRPVQPDGTFVLDGLTPGRYQVTAVVPDGYAVRAIRVGGEDAFDLPVTIEPGVSADSPHIEVALTDRLASLTGLFQDASGRPATDYQMVVFPSDQRYWDATSRRITTARPATDGRFLFPALPPGAYRLAALTDVEDGEWLDPTFLERLIPAAIEVTIAEGEQTVQDVRISGGSE
jgi:uncharacterized protein (DUF2141 family)